MNTKQKKADLEKLTKSVRLWQIIVCSYVIFVFLIYFLWFGISNSGTISHETSKWGEFGDYVGGVLNPVLALAAFFWLTKGVRYQKEELIAAAVALEDASRSGREQAEAMKDTATMNTLAALITAVSGDIEQSRSEAEFISGQLVIGKDGRSTAIVITSAGIEMKSGEAREKLKDMHTAYQALIAERTRLKAAVEKRLHGNLNVQPQSE